MLSGAAAVGQEVWQPEPVHPEELCASLVRRATRLQGAEAVTAVRAWKTRHPGGQAVGCLPVWAPRLLVHAAGMLPVGLAVDAGLEVVRGDAWVQSHVCQLPRSVLEIGHSALGEALDGVIFPGPCDVVRNLSGMWALLFPEAWVHYFEWPQQVASALVRPFLRDQLAALWAALTQRCHGGQQRPSSAALHESWGAYARQQRQVQALYAARAKAPWCFPAGEFYPLLRAQHLLPVEEHTALVQHYLACAPRRQSPRLDNIRVVVRGIFCEPPPLEFLQLIEAAGCSIVDDDVEPRWRDGALAAAGAGEADPFACLARWWTNLVDPGPLRYQAPQEAARELLDAVRRGRADGVIFCAAHFCDPALLEHAKLTAALNAAKVPHVLLKYSENSGFSRDVAQQVGVFADAIRLWGAP